ncbi:hypothetical protein [Methylobacterium oryzisoli]|uniref:hypothetical protein n=1 Tax=Methylobacterium oryzisoli TaxID=3385502 RepID=UPI0038915D17
MPERDSPLTAAALLRRARDAAAERTAFALVASLALVSGSFAAVTIAGGVRPYAVRAVVPAGIGPMAWKKGVAAQDDLTDLDPMITGSLPEAPPPAAPPRPDAGPAEHRYRLKAVAGGVALIEGAGRTLQAVPGTELPGAGRVLSILPAGTGWVVVTSQTIIAAGP